jgi:predicted CXXCH cytochrome family protein
VTIWQEGVAHEPAREDCTTCHSSHGSRTKDILSSSRKELCANCHGIEEPEFIRTHSGIKPGPESCYSCHNPHGGADKKLLHPIMHDPFAEGSCRPCHPGGAK